MLKKENTSAPYLRLFNCLPNSTIIDFYIDDVLWDQDIWYKDFTYYKSISSGSHQVTITPHNQTEVLCTRSIWISHSKIYTLIISLDLKLNCPALYLLNDYVRPIPDAHCLIRFGHFSASLPPTDVYLSEEQLLFKKIPYHEMTTYLALTPGSYHLDLKDHETNETLYTLPELHLKVSRFYSLYLIGNHDKTYPTITTLSIDGNSFLKC